MRALFPLLMIVLAACARTAPADDVCGDAPGDGLAGVNAWVRAQPAAGGSTAAYFTLCNNGASAVTVTGVESDVAKAEMHQTKRSADGVVSMTLIDAITVAPGERGDFEPGGAHVMLLSLEKERPAGERTSLRIVTADGQSIKVSAEIRPLAEPSHQH